LVAYSFELLQAIREITDQPIRVAVISHYHADHIYGLQAFVDHAGVEQIIAQARTADYRDGDAISQGEDALRRLEQRRAVLFPWVDGNTRIVAATRTFESSYQFETGGVGFEIRHLGPAHASGDAVMLVGDYGVLFSGDLVYKGRIPYLDSPHTDVVKWLDGLEQIASAAPELRFLIPGHGEPSTDIASSIAATRDYIRFLVNGLKPAVEDFKTFEEAYSEIDWSPYAEMPVFDASNRGNAFRVFLEPEAQSI
jgi:glyoxylase-like metal-dependent hydrolase (beta-lactamase superfamily II)